MATINQKIQTLISDVNGITGCSDTDLTSAIRTLAAGYGQGGGGGAEPEMINVYFDKRVVGLGGWTLSELGVSALESEHHFVQTFDPFTMELKTWTPTELMEVGGTITLHKGSILLLPPVNQFGCGFDNPDSFGEPGSYALGTDADPYGRQIFSSRNVMRELDTRVIIAGTDLYCCCYACLRPDALITLADGSTKRVCELSLDDKVLGYNPQGELVAQSLTYIDAKEHKTHSEYDRWIFSDGTVLETVHQHRFYNYDLRRMEYMQRWELGQHTLKLDGSTPYLIAHETIKEPTEHYTLFCEFNNYFADGCLSGNRHTPELNLPNKHDDLISKLLINK